ncbi:MAG: APC family permease, partial [Ktedonobacterales bacterium]
YYTPGILFGDPRRGTGVGDLAGLFVTMTLVVFLLLTLKYAEVSVRFPEGGGVVTVSARGINPWAGAVGGMFILVDYFLTSAISSLSGVQYFETLVPSLSNIVVQLIITIILIGLLGLLNWYGIRESAAVSAGIAVAAFISDMLILAVVFIKVPLHVIGAVFHTMFTGHNLTVPLVLTGYAGAFLAFSGLESISQLAPVMALPRNKTVVRALALVVITVGVTSPLLTIFSTTLLTHPELLRQTQLIAPHVTDLPSLENQFISQLGYSAGGRLLEVLTAVTAATLLVFASNTAIIGAYHVFLALSRMQFFPKIIEKHNAMRGTPHISIVLATVVPVLVLLAVGGQISILGDMYAFGLLGAFSLTCISLDFIRWRERHGERPVGSHAEHDMVVATPMGARVAATPGMGVRLASYATGRMSPQVAARVTTARTQMAVAWTTAARYAGPHVVRVRGLWPDIRYYLGFLTTVLVGAAWLINLRAKPLATVFGGGLTVLGVAIAVVNYRYQQRQGTGIIQPAYYLRPAPHSRLVVLDPRSSNNAAVVRGACQTAQGHSLIVLCLGYPPQRELRVFAINDAYLNDTAAQETLRIAARICKAEHVEAQFLYRVAQPNAVLDAWRVIQPDEIVAEASLAKEFAKRVTPDYVRLQQVDGVKVVHAMRRRVSPLETTGGDRGAATAEAGVNGMSGMSGMSGAQRTSGAPEQSAAPVAPVASSGGGTNGAKRKAAEVPPAPAGATPPRTPVRPAEAIPPAQPHPQPRTEATPPRTEPQPQPQQTGPVPANVDMDDYVWTGTSLVRRDEYEREQREREQREREQREREGEGQQEEPEQREAGTADGQEEK